MKPKAGTFACSSVMHFCSGPTMQNHSGVDICLAHLIRDVQYAMDCGDDVIGPDLRHLLGEACDIGARREALSDATLKSYKARLETRLTRILARTPAHEAGVKLIAMIKRTRQYLFVFMTNRELPPTNTGHATGGA